MLPTGSCIYVWTYKTEELSDLYRAVPKIPAKFREESDRYWMV